MVHGMIARTAAAMTPAPPMQRKAIRRTVVAVLPIRTILAIRAVRALTGLWRLLTWRLAPGDE
jgi:hypothetical protein